MKNSPVNSYWLMTFGDLLTLLLCFFVAIVSLSRHQQDADAEEMAKEKKEQLVESIDEVARLTAGASHGAEIALDIDNRNLTEVFLEQGDVDPGKQRLTDSGKVVLERAVDLLSYPVKEVVIETCSRQAEANAWHESVSMSLGIQRQIHDMKVGTPAYRVKSVGPHCTSLGLTEKTQVSRILFQGSPEEANGRRN